MKTTPVTIADITGSLMSVPPLARDPDFGLDRDQNRKLIAHIEAGGVTTHLYGGNANFYALTMAGFEAALDLLPDVAGTGSWVIPSVGADYGKLMDQAAVARNTRFPTFITLPQAFGITPDGVERGIREFVQAVGRPVILYLKAVNYLTPDHAARLVDDGQACAIKYGINGPDPGVDPYLNALVQTVDRGRIIIVGERAAVAQHQAYNLGAMMSGCASIAPLAVAAMFEALKADDYATAEAIRDRILPMEDLRDAVGPIPVLHDAVTLAGIAAMGPLTPLVANVADSHRPAVERAAKDLLAGNDPMTVRLFAASA